MARGLNIGDFAKAFNSTYDTANKVAQDFEVAKVVNEKPIDSFGLSTDQNEQVFQALADGGTAKDVRNGFGLFSGVAVSNPMPEGFEGPPQAKTFTPQKITSYLGKEFVGGLDPAKATSLRNRALAGIITKSDPIQGMKLDALLTQDERADQEYSEKEQAKALRQQFVAERNPFKRADIGRQLSGLTGGGEFLKGFGDIEKANLTAVTNHARGFLARGDVKGFMGVYDHYDNGENGEVVDLPGGGYQFNFYQGKSGGDNKPTGSRQFKSIDEISQWFNDIIDPEAAAKRKAEAATDALKFGREVQKAMLLEQVKAQTRKDTLRPGYKWEIDPETGESTGTQVRQGGAAASSGARGKPAKTPQDQAQDNYREIANAYGKDYGFDPGRDALGTSVTREAMQLNPGLDPAVAAHAGLIYADPETRKKGGIVLGWDDNSGSYLEQVQTPQGLVAANRVTFRNAAAMQLPPQKIQEAVESSIKSLTLGDPSKRQLAIQAASDPVARRTLIDGIARKTLESDQRFKALNPQGQALKLKEQTQLVDQQLAVPLGWILNFGQAAKQGAASSFGIPAAQPNLASAPAAPVEPLHVRQQKAYDEWQRQLSDSKTWYGGQATLGPGQKERLEEAERNFTKLISQTQ